MMEKQKQSPSRNGGKAYRRNRPAQGRPLKDGGG